MKSALELSNGSFGVCATIVGEWQDYFLDIINNNNIQEIEINDGKGWRGQSIDFLENLSVLKSLTIIDYNLENFNPIYKLCNLMKLDLHTYCKSPVDFRVFTKLKECAFEWINGSDYLFEIKTIGA
jgi:hypothetical protein